MHRPPTEKFTLNDLRQARATGVKVPMLTCYDYTTARIMHEAGVPILLVGDSAANVILGHPTTLPVGLDFMIELTAAVRRGAPNCLVMADMPFGSVNASVAQGVRNVCRMVQLSGCDCVKIEAAAGMNRLIRRLADAGVAVVAHIGLRPQSVGVLGSYKAQGRTADAATGLVRLARKLEAAGAAAILVEATPPQVTEAVVGAVGVPVLGCGAGPACCAHVVVTHDLLRLTPAQPRFVPRVGELGPQLKQILGRYVDDVGSGRYPSDEHLYDMPADEREELARRRALWETKV
jgi:3-methyl-2-oxobutanoate hydroxymethyltransferase